MAICCIYFPSRVHFADVRQSLSYNHHSPYFDLYFGDLEGQESFKYNAGITDMLIVGRVASDSHD